MKNVLPFLTILQRVHLSLLNVLNLSQMKGSKVFWLKIKNQIKLLKINVRKIHLLFIIQLCNYYH